MHIVIPHVAHPRALAMARGAVVTAIALGAAFGMDALAQQAPGAAPRAPSGGPSLGAQPSPHPDIPVGKSLTAYVGPRFLTGDALLPEARAVLVDETGRVRALLRNAPAAGLYPVVTLPGALAVPGLHDAHVHLQGIGRAVDDVDLQGVRSAAEARARVAAWAAAHPDAAVIHGRGWDQTLFPNAAWPSWRDLEGADVRGRAIMLRRVDGHAAWVNKALLDRAEITRRTPDPRGGKILRDASGDPTGVLVDNAMDLAARPLPPPSMADEERWLVAGMAAAADAGLTAVHDMGMSARAARLLLRLDGEGKVPLRVFVYLDDTDPEVPALLDEQPRSARVTFMGVKLFADGAMGSRGAALLDDYHDEPGNRGLLLLEPAALRARVAAIHKRGLAAAVHAIGDRGNRVVLDAMAAHPAPPGVRDRVEHAQLLHATDIARFAALGVTASMQPVHATSDMRWAEQRVGPGRIAGAYAWRSLLDAGARVAFGSDAPVEDVRPIYGIYAALTRQDLDGQPSEGFLPAQRLTQHEAVAAFSAGAAAAVGMEQVLGALTPGMFFDVTLLRDDAAARTAAGQPKAWVETVPTATIVAGALRRCAVP